MLLIVVYLAFAVVGNVGVWFIGRVIEAMWPSASLPAFLALFFTVLWIAWILAVKVTEPAHATRG